MIAMTTPADPGAQSPRAAQRSGCGLRGCLIGCFIPIAALIVALLIARPTLQEKWTKLRAENPWVAQVPGIAAVLKEVVGGSTDSAAAGTADTSKAARSPHALKGVNDKSAMPPDLPLWPRPKAETFSAGQDQAAAYQRVRQPADSVLRYFRRTMPSKGWKLDQERTGAGGTLLLYRKPDRIARVEVVADTAGTEIWIRSRSTLVQQR
jgi:hypothetical protein